VNEQLSHKKTKKPTGGEGGNADYKRWHNQTIVTKGKKFSLKKQRGIRSAISEKNVKRGINEARGRETPI